MSSYLGLSTVAVLRLLASVSDPANAHLFSAASARAAFAHVKPWPRRACHRTTSLGREEMKVRHIKRHRCRPALARWLRRAWDFVREAKALSALLQTTGLDEEEPDPHDEAHLFSPPDGRTDLCESEEEVFRKVRERLASKRSAVAVRVEDL